MKYTITKSTNPLKSPIEENTNIFDHGNERDSTDVLDTAVQKFIKACSKLDTGCVQLWYGAAEIGKLYL